MSLSYHRNIAKFYGSIMVFNFTHLYYTYLPTNMLVGSALVVPIVNVTFSLFLPKWLFSLIFVKSIMCTYFVKIGRNSPTPNSK